MELADGDEPGNVDIEHPLFVRPLSAAMTTQTRRYGQ
jgi:hypothetical protein